MEHPFSQFKYCPKCGSVHFEINNEKSKRCADCEFVYYFNPSAATVALIMNERNELLVCRRAKAEYLFSLPNIYVYSGFTVHTLDLFFRCTVTDTLHYQAMDDAADVFFLPLKDIHTEDFGLSSIRKGVGIFLKEMGE